MEGILSSKRFKGAGERTRAKEERARVNGVVLRSRTAFTFTNCPEPELRGRWGAGEGRRPTAKCGQAEEADAQSGKIRGGRSNGAVDVVSRLPATARCGAGRPPAAASSGSSPTAESPPLAPRSLRLPIFFFLFASSASSACPLLAVGLRPSPTPHLPRSSGFRAACPKEHVKWLSPSALANSVDQRGGGGVAPPPLSRRRRWMKRRNRCRGGPGA